MDRIDSLLDTAPCGFLSFGDDGKLLAANATLLEWLGYSFEEACDRHVETLMPVATRIFYQTHFFPLLKLTGKVAEVYLTLRTKTGEDLPVLTNALRREQDGHPVNDCVFMVVRQRSLYEDEILQAKRSAEEARLWLSTTLQSIGDAVIATDAVGQVVFLNLVAETLTGWPQEQATGKPIDEILVILNEETRLPAEDPVARGGSMFRSHQWLAAAGSGRSECGISDRLTRPMFPGQGLAEIYRERFGRQGARVSRVGACG